MQVVLLGAEIIAILFGSTKDLLVCARRESRERHWGALKFKPVVGEISRLGLTASRRLGSMTAFPHG